MTLFRHSILIASMLLSLSPGVALTQQRKNTTERKEASGRCAEAREILAERDIESEDGWAFSAITTCPGAADVLAGVWAHPPTNPDLLRALVHRSGNISDGRILNAAIAAMQSTTVEAQRRAALRAVLAQYNPRVRMMSGTWSDPEHRGLGLESDYYQAPGEQPVTAADQQLVIDTFRKMSTTATDSLWRGIATRIVLDLTQKPYLMLAR